MVELGGLYLAQADGGPPTTLAAGSAPGESGVSVFSLRFRGPAHGRGTMRQHLMCFQMSPRVRLDCRIAGHRLRHEARTGSLAIYPAGSDCTVESDASADALMVAIQPGQLALAAAEESAPGAQLIERLIGYDPALLALTRTLASEAAAGNPNGPLYWHDAASDLLDRLVAGHTSAFPGRPRGMLGQAVLGRLREYVVAHLDEPLEVAALAAIAGCSPFHFSRMFTRAVGLAPHQYVVRLRLRRAVELVREARAGLAEIAARTGFADQSHLSRWVRRVYGVSPTQLAA